MPNTLIIRLSDPVFLQKLNMRLAQLAGFLLVISCAWLLVQITWLLIPQEEGVLLPPVHPQARVQAFSTGRQNSLDKLTAISLFGVSEKTTVRSSKAPETRLNLTLKGVLAAVPMERASAIIAKGKNGREDIYSAGDKMPGGVIIREIHADHVILDRGGKLETLKLQKLTGVAGASRVSGSRSSMRSSRRANTPEAALKQVRRNIMSNPTSFGDYALPIVVKENGKQVGYRLQPQEKGQLLAELGIQANDIITEINGVKLDKPQNGIAALRKLSTAKTLNIVVKRNGAEVPLSISLQ